MKREHLQNINNKAIEMWEDAKLVLIHATPGLMKWWAHTRYQGHTRAAGVIKCTCERRPTLNQIHIIHCQRFQQAYQETATQLMITTGEVKVNLAARKVDVDEIEQIFELNTMEQILTEKIN